MIKRNRWSAWWSSFWGFCPQCNSDAPNLYDCKVCNYDTTSPFLSRTKRMFLWKRYKNQ